MPIIIDNERALLWSINQMDKTKFSQYIHEADEETIDAIMDTIRKAHMLKLQLPIYLSLLSEREETVLDKLGKNNRLSIQSLYNALDQSTSETLFILGFRADTQYFIAQEYLGPESPPNIGNQNDSTLSP